MQIESIKINFWNVFKVALPLMISALSSHFMLILDQLVLARYSFDAMTGASSASVWCGTIQYASMSITMIAGAFVGNYNGAKKFKSAAIPVWQMIWFSLALFSISIPIALFTANLCIPESLQSEGVPYFKILMSMTPICGVYYSLSPFFIAIGKGYLITISTIIANVINLVVDIVLVFGLFGFDHFKGAEGAAIGTVFANLTNISILFFFFFQKDIREKYDTLNLKLRIKKLIEYLRMGVIGGIGHIFEMFAWSVVYYLLASLGKDIALIQSIAVSVNLFIAFIVSGLEKGVMAITSNLLGAGLQSQIPVLLKKGISIHFLFASLFAMIVFFFPELILNNFIKFQVSEEITARIILVLKLVLLYFFVDGMTWCIAGVIEAGGDINYTMMTIASCLWTIVTIPSYILYKFGLLQIEITWLLLLTSVVSMVFLLYHRYKSNKWIHIKV